MKVVGAELRSDDACPTAQVGLAEEQRHPTCGRLVGDMFSIVDEVEAAVKARKFTKDLSVAIMGCAVNGPGEAAGAEGAGQQGLDFRAVSGGFVDEGERGRRPAGLEGHGGLLRMRVTASRPA